MTHAAWKRAHDCEVVQGIERNYGAMMSKIQIEIIQILGNDINKYPIARFNWPLVKLSITLNIFTWKTAVDQQVCIQKLK